METPICALKRPIQADHLGAEANDEEEKELKEGDDQQVEGGGGQVGKTFHFKEHREEHVALYGDNVRQADGEERLRAAGVDLHEQAKSQVPLINLGPFQQMGKLLYRFKVYFLQIFNECCTRITLLTMATQMIEPKMARQSKSVVFLYKLALPFFVAYS